MDDTNSTVSALLIYKTVAEPIILATIPLLIGWGLTLLSNRYSVLNDAHLRDRISTAAFAAAGRVVAAAEGPLANIAIPVGDPRIASEVPKVLAVVGDIAGQLGITSEGIANMIAGRVGILQSQGGASSPSISAPAAEVQNINVTNEAPQH